MITQDSLCLTSFYSFYFYSMNNISLKRYGHFYNKRESPFNDDLYIFVSHMAEYLVMHQTLQCDNDIIEMHVK